MKKKDIVPYNLRIPKTLKAKITKQAKEDGRSLNNWIVRALEDYTRTQENRPAPAS